MPFAGWSPIGIAALIAIVAGIVLLVIYAVQRGLVHRELEGIEETPGAAAGTEAPAAHAATPRRSRTLGALGATLLAAGLVLGVLSAVGSWGTDTGAAGPGATSGDCAQSWNGCPKSTPRP